MDIFSNIACEIEPNLSALPSNTFIPLSISKSLKPEINSSSICR